MKLKTYLVQLLIAVALVLPMMGCPSGPPTLALGVWVFTISTTGGGDQEPALTLLAGGQTETPSPLPPGVSEMFSGVLTWAQNGSAFSLNQVIGVNNEVLHTGTVQSSSAMSGTWTRTLGGVGSGTWSAVLLP